MGRDGKERALMDGDQHVQMHGGGHVRKTGRGLITPKTQVGNWGEWEVRVMGAPVLLLCPVERYGEAGNLPLFPRNLLMGWGDKTDPGEAAPG